MVNTPADRGTKTSPPSRDNLSRAARGLTTEGGRLDPGDAVLAHQGTVTKFDGGDGADRLPLGLIAYDVNV